MAAALRLPKNGGVPALGLLTTHMIGYLGLVKMFLVASLRTPLPQEIWGHEAAHTAELAARYDG